MRDMYGPAQDVWRLGHFHMPLYPGGLRCGTLSMLAPMGIIKLAEDGGEDGIILRWGVQRCSGHPAGRPNNPYHFQRGGGCGGTTLDFSDGGERGRAEQERTRGQT